MDALTFAAVVWTAVFCALVVIAWAMSPSKGEETDGYKRTPHESQAGGTRKGEGLQWPVIDDEVQQ